MNPTLHSPETVPTRAAARLTEIYAGLIGRTTLEWDKIQKDFEEASETWTDLGGRARFSNGRGVIGTIARGSITEQWGSLDLSLGIKVKTSDGPRDLVYSQRLLRPPFEILPPRVDRRDAFPYLLDSVRLAEAA